MRHAYVCYAVGGANVKNRIPVPRSRGVVVDDGVPIQLEVEVVHCVDDSWDENQSRDHQERNRVQPASVPASGRVTTSFSIAYIPVHLSLRIEGVNAEDRRHCCRSVALCHFLSRLSHVRFAAKSRTASRTAQCDQSPFAARTNAT